MPYKPSIFFLSYGVWGRDGRLAELMAAAEKTGNVFLLALSLEGDMPLSAPQGKFVTIKNFRLRLSFRNYWHFVYAAIGSAWRQRRPDVCIVDDLMSTLCAIIILPILRPHKVVLDCREFYYRRKMPGLGRVFVAIERWLAKRVDLVIVANEERADLMKILYHLDSRPVVFENIRFLPASNEILPTRLVDLLALYSDKIKLVSTGGCSVERGTLNLLDAMRKNENCHLFILGRGHDKDYEKVLAHIGDHEINNVTVLDRLPLNLLGSFVSACDIGVVEYHQNDLNNIFCASGKVYEYASLGLPIVCTPNFSLKQICARYGIGEAGPEMADNIRKVSGAHSTYVSNIQNIANEVNPDENACNLKHALLEILA